MHIIVKTKYFCFTTNIMQYVFRIQKIYKNSLSKKSALHKKLFLYYPNIVSFQKTVYNLKIRNTYYRKFVFKLYQKSVIKTFSFQKILFLSSWSLPKNLWVTRKKKLILLTSQQSKMCQNTEIYRKSVTKILLSAELYSCSSQCQKIYL